MNMVAMVIYICGCVGYIEYWLGVVTGTSMYGADRLKFLLVGSGFTLPRSNDRCTVYVTVVVVAFMASTGTG